MQSTWIFKLERIFVFAIFATSMSGACWAQDSPGSDDLDKAFVDKVSAQGLKDLDAVVKLCESAIKKGLDESGVVQAKRLAAASLYEHADQLSQRIFASKGQDRRWRMFRSQALSRLKKAIKLQPEMAECYLMIAKLNGLPGGDEDAALDAVDKAVELAGDDREQLSGALYIRATMSDDEDSQIADLNQAIKINPENMDAIRTRGLIYLKQKKTDKAMEDIKLWLNDGEKNTDNYLAVVTMLMAMEEQFDDKLQDEAFEIISDAIDHDPENAKPHIVRAQLNVFLENLDGAVEDAGRALKIDRRNLGALLLRATIYSEQDKLDEALDDINALLKLEPNLIRGIEMRGRIFSLQEKFDEAIEDFKTLSVNDEENQFLKRQLAMLYNADDRPKEAIEIYDELLKLNAKGSWEGKSNPKKLVFMSRRMGTLRGRGDARLSTGEHNKAVADYDEALELQYALRKIQEEIQEEKGGELDPEDDGVLNNLAWVLATSTFDDVRDGVRAVELATKAAEVTEFKQAHILSTLASGYAEMGDFENAIKWIEKAIEVNREEGTNDEQKESLQTEYESYKNKKPWREMQNEGKSAELKKDEKKDSKMAEDDSDKDKKGEAEKDEDEYEKDDDGKDDSDDKDSDGDDSSDDKSKDKKSKKDKSDDGKQ